jgi:hypothetical protein
MAKNKSIVGIVIVAITRKRSEAYLTNLLLIEITLTQLF